MYSNIFFLFYPQLLSLTEQLHRMCNSYAACVRNRFHRIFGTFSPFIAKVSQSPPWYIPNLLLETIESCYYLDNQSMFGFMSGTPIPRQASEKPCTQRPRISPVSTCQSHCSITIAYQVDRTVKKFTWHREVASQTRGILGCNTGQMCQTHSGAITRVLDTLASGPER